MYQNPGVGDANIWTDEWDEGEGVTIDLHVVVEYGLNLAEVASTVRNRVAYEVGRLTGLSVRAVEVHIEDVRRSG